MLAHGSGGGSLSVYHRRRANGKNEISNRGIAKRHFSPHLHICNRKVSSVTARIDSAISGKGGGMVNWYVVDAKTNEQESNQRAESFIIEIESKLKPAPQRTRQPIRDTAQAVAISFVKGFENIEHKGISPPYLSEFGLERLQAMMGLLHRNGARGFTAEIMEPNRAVAVTDKAAKTLAELLPPRRVEEGSVEGTLETVSVHKNKKFVIYDSLTGKGVTCLIDDGFPHWRLLARISARR